MKYAMPDIRNWKDDDPRKGCLSWDKEVLRNMYNETQRMFQPPVSEVAQLIYHPCHPFLHRCCGVCLDIGCGNGSILASLVDFNVIDKGIGIDISDVVIENARQTAENMKVSSALEFHAIPVEDFDSDIQFDTIIAYDVLEHLFSVTENLDKIQTLLKPNGIFLGTVPAGRDCDGTKYRVHLHYFEKDDLLNLFQPLFSKVTVQGKRISPGEYRYYFACKGKNELE
jgi:SAM-dependent methyltransferase